MNKMISQNELKELLSKNIVTFAFRKRNGERRVAKGTRNGDFAEKATGNFNSPSGRGYANDYAFWDCEKGDWRSYAPALNAEIELIAIGE